MYPGVLGLEFTVSRGLGFSNRKARLMVEARKEETQCDFLKRPQIRRQRRRQRDSDYGAPPRSNLIGVYNVATQKNDLVSGGKALSPIEIKNTVGNISKESKL